MSETTRNRIFGFVMFWTVLTTIFAWLPLVRIIGRPEGYTWGILGMSGSGLGGPFLIFVPLTMFVVGLLFTAARGPRRIFYPMLLLWHSAVLGVAIAALVLAGSDAAFQGQGLHFKIPMWILAAPIGLVFVLVGLWVAADSRQPAKKCATWSRGNTMRLVVSMVLLACAIVLFRLGTNYNWVTAVAIGFTIAHWVMLTHSFDSIEPTEPPRVVADDSAAAVRPLIGDGSAPTDTETKRSTLRWPGRNRWQMTFANGN